jgi:sugar phosphate isomerase/epimerase
MRFGCSTLLYGGYDLGQALAGIQQAGYEALELGAIPGMGEHLRLQEDENVYQQVREDLAAHNLYLESVGGSGALGAERFEPLMAAAAILGAPYMTLGSGGMADDGASWRHTVDAVRAALPVCERTGVRLSVKPHVRAAVYDVATATRFMEELATPWVGLNLDNTHLQRAGDDPVAAVEALKSWVFTARIRDFKSSDLSIGPVESQIPGKGQADVAGYLRALCQVPGLEYTTVEMVGTKDFPLSEVQRVIGETLVALRSYL